MSAGRRVLARASDDRRLEFEPHLEERRAAIVMDAAGSSASSYIPITTQEARHYGQGSATVSHAPSATVAAEGAGGDGSTSGVRMSLLRPTHAVAGNGIYEDAAAVVPISAAAASPPSYVLSSGREAGPRLPPDGAIEMRGEAAAIGQPPAYQLDLQQHGISSLAPPGGGGHHPHYPGVWLSEAVQHGLKQGSIPNSVPLPPVSEVHPSRGPKLAPRLNENNSASVDESDPQSNLHSYLTQVLPNIQDSAVVKVPVVAPPTVSLPPLRASKPQQQQQQHHNHDHLLSVTTAEQLSSAGLLTDASSVVTSMDARASNIYSIAPSQVSAVSGSHALTLDTGVHTQLSAMMQHHSHDAGQQQQPGGHYPGSLMQHLGLGLEVEMDKHHQHIHHPANTLIGSSGSIPMMTADISGVLADHRPHIMDNFSVIYSSGGGCSDHHHHHHHHAEMVPLKHNHMPQDGMHLPPDLGSMQLQEASFQQTAAGGEAKDLVETLACYRCKVCPFISFSKEGVEQHVRATHLKQEAEAGDPQPQPPLQSGEDAVPELCAQEIEIHQQQAAEGELEHGKENTYICGMCDRGFTDIESCGVHMAVDHNLPVDQVHLEPLPTMPAVSSVPEALPPTQPQAPLPPPQTRPLQPLLPAPVAQPQKPAVQSRQAACPVGSQDGQQPLPEETAKPTAVARRRKAAKKPQHGDPEKSAAAESAEEDRRGGDRIATIKQETDEKRDGGSGENRDSCGEANADSADSSPNNAVGKSGAKKRGRPRGSKTLGITALKKKNRASKAAEDHLLGFRCDVHGCAVRMQSLENLEYHRKCHTDDVEHFECPECNARYDNWKSTSVHLWRTHVVDMELYSCDLCSYKTYSYGKLMNMHRRIHSEERLFMCDVCGRCFKTNKQLRNHKVIHLDKRKNRSFRSGECDICNRHFSDKRMLRVHKDTVHNKLRPYLCQYCSYTASCRSTLKMHIRQHTGEKPFACEMCDYRTADHNSLRRHKMRHSGEKPYKCPFCPYKSIQSSTYKTHLKNKHPGLDEGLLFSCDHCPFRTIKKENYITHMADHKNGGLPLQMTGGSNQGVLPAAGTSIPEASLASSSYFSSHPAAASMSSDVALQSQMEVVPFIFSVPEEMRQRISQQQIYAVVDSDNPEERFPILASQLKIGQVVGGQRENDEEHILPHTSMDSMEAGHRIQIISSQEQAAQEADAAVAASAGDRHEALSHAQLTPVPPESILPN